MSVTTRSNGRTGRNNPKAMKTNPKDPIPAKMPENRRILEWISLKDAPNGVIPNSDEIFAILQEIQKLQECTGVARGRPQELRNIEWLIIGTQYSVLHY